MKLQAKDLMIGDWVQVEAHRGFKSQKVKVMTIPDYDDDNDYGHHYGCIGAWLQGGDNDFRDIKTSHLRPIPLTPEILVKNGFVNKRNHWMQSGNFDDQPLMMWYLKDGIILHAHKYQMEIHYSAKNCHCAFICKYVHQLQHALKLCGIDKEIELC